MPDVILPHDLQNGPTHPNDATEVMANFNAILAVLNGGLDAENLATALNNSFLKLDVAGDHHVAWGTDVLPNFAADDGVVHKDIAHGLEDTPTWAGAFINASDIWAMIRVHTLGAVSFRVEGRAIAAGAYPTGPAFLWAAIV